MFKSKHSFHDGFFGAFVRFLPIFDKKYDIVYVMDVDLPNNFFSKSYETLLLKFNADILINTYLFYDKPWAKVNFPILGGLLFTKFKFDINLLYDFFYDVKKGKYNELIYNISTKHDNVRITDAKYFPFGMDEYFLNHILRYSFKKNKLKVIVNVIFNYGKFMRHLYFNDHLFTKDEANKMYKLENLYWYGDYNALDKMIDIFKNNIRKLTIYNKYKKNIDIHNEFIKKIVYDMPGISAYKIFDMIKEN